MKIICTIKDKKIEDSCNVLLTHFNDQDFLNMVCLEKFSYTNDSGVEVARRIKIGPIAIQKIVAYKTKWPWSSVLGYYENNTYFLNTRKMDISVLDRAENLFHELVGHGCGYTHKEGKQDAESLNSVPYKSGEMFKSYIKSIGVLK